MLHYILYIMHYILYTHRTFNSTFKIEIFLHRIVDNKDLNMVKNSDEELLLLLTLNDGPLVGTYYHFLSFLSFLSFLPISQFLLGADKTVEDFTVIYESDDETTYGDA